MWAGFSYLKNSLLAQLKNKQTLAIKTKSAFGRILLPHQSRGRERETPKRQMLAVISAFYPAAQNHCLCVAVTCQKRNAARERSRQRLTARAGPRPSLVNARSRE